MPFRSGEVIKISRAILSKDIEEVCRLLNQHVENNDELKGNSPLFIACAVGLLQAVQFLVEIGKMNIYEKNKNGITPLLIATNKGHTRVIEYLQQEIKKQQEINEKKETMLASINKQLLEINALKKAISSQKQDINSLSREREEQTLSLMEELNQEKFRNIQISI